MSRQYLTFVLGAETYGVDILAVQEIKGAAAITPIPNTPPFVRGVMNLRGAILPVVDLRSKFGMPPASEDVFTVIVVMTVGTRTIGVLVDAVSDVLGIPAAAVQPPPDFGANDAIRCVSGVAMAGDRMVLVLDIERVLATEALVPA